MGTPQAPLNVDNVRAVARSLARVHGIERRESSTQEKDSAQIAEARLDRLTVSLTAEQRKKLITSSAQLHGSPQLDNFFIRNDIAVMTGYAHGQTGTVVKDVVIVLEEIQKNSPATFTELSSAFLTTYFGSEEKEQVQKAA